MGNSLYNSIEAASNQELNALISLSIGRILRMGSRPEQPGDGAEFNKYATLAKYAGAELKDRGVEL